MYWVIFSGDHSIIIKEGFFLFKASEIFLTGMLLIKISINFDKCNTNQIYESKNLKYTAHINVKKMHSPNRVLTFACNSEKSSFYNITKPKRS